MLCIVVAEPLRLCPLPNWGSSVSVRLCGTAVIEGDGDRLHIGAGPGPTVEAGAQEVQDLRQPGAEGQPIGGLRRPKMCARRCSIRA